MGLLTISDKFKKEYLFFLQKPRDMRVLLATNMIYAFVIPIIEIFVGAYIMRNSNDPTIVAIYQLTVYTGIPFTFLLNGFLLRRFKITTLYSLGMLLSGLSMVIMMTLESLSLVGIGVAGILMGCSFGFFWANRDFLALDTTNDDNRNYYYGLETFFYTVAGVTVPLLVGVFLAHSYWLDANINKGYQIVTGAVFILTIFSSMIIHKEKFRNPAQKQFIFFKFHKLWKNMLVLSGLKGITQGYLVTAPAILIMRLVGNEGSLGITQSVSGIVAAVMLYIIGRVTKPGHRIYIFSIGLLVFLLGTFANGILFSAVGVIIFILCKVIFQPLHDIAYFPIQMRVIDVVSKIERRSEFAYIFNHEFGLYVGRFLGLGLFILLATYVSEIFALKYSLMVVAVIQLASIPMAKYIIKLSDVLQKQEAKENISEVETVPGLQVQVK